MKPNLPVKLGLFTSPDVTANPTPINSTPINVSKAITNPNQSLFEKMKKKNDVQANGVSSNLYGRYPQNTQSYKESFNSHTMSDPYNGNAYHYTPSNRE